MAIKVREMGRSRSISEQRSERGGSDGEATLLYWIDGTSDPDAAEAAVLNVAPRIYRGMLVDSYSMDAANELGNSWNAEFQYNSKRLKEGEFRWSIDTSGATTKVDQAYEWQDYGTGVNNSKGHIPDGVTIGIPQMNITCRARIPADFITLQYIQVLKSLTYHTNQYDFGGFAAGELLYLGTQVEITVGQSTDINFKFSASENVTNLTLGSITGISKKGHDYLWIKKKDVQGDQGTSLEREIERVTVGRVYNQGDFNLLRIGEVA